MNANTICSVDDIREKHPELGVCLYAMTPGEPVTLEVHTPDGGMFSWNAATTADAIALAFPAESPDQEYSEPKEPETAGTVPSGTVFD